MSPEARTKILLLLILLMSVVTAGSLSLMAYVVTTDKRPFGLQTLKAFRPPAPLDPGAYEADKPWMLVLRPKPVWMPPLRVPGKEPTEAEIEEKKDSLNPIRAGSKNEEFVDKMYGAMEQRRLALEEREKAQKDREKLLQEMVKSNQSLLAAVGRKEEEIKKRLDDQKAEIDRLILARAQANSEVLQKIDIASAANLQTLADTVDKMRPDAQMLAINAMDVGIAARALMRLDPAKRATILANMLEGKTKTPDIFPAALKKTMREQAQQIMLEIKRMTEGKAP